MSFHVNEHARNRTHPSLWSSPLDGHNGLFDFSSPEPGWRLAVICSDGDGWEHVSVHAYRGQPGDETKIRTPTWKEMCFIKDQHWDGEDVVIQFHPRKSEYINQHPCTLHLWRSLDQTVLTPPPHLVGDATATAVQFRVKTP
jgi:hypothetical protein